MSSSLLVTAQSSSLAFAPVTFERSDAERNGPLGSESDSRQVEHLFASLKVAKPLSRTSGKDFYLKNYALKQNSSYALPNPVRTSQSASKEPQSNSTADMSSFKNTLFDFDQDIRNSVHESSRSSLLQMFEAFDDNAKPPSTRAADSWDPVPAFGFDFTPDSKLDSPSIRVTAPAVTPRSIVNKSVDLKLIVTEEVKCVQRGFSYESFNRFILMFLFVF